MEDQPPHRYRRLQNIPPLSTVEPPPPPQRRRLDTEGSFESFGVSQIPGEYELHYTQIYHSYVEVEVLQAQEFATNYNPPITDLSGTILVQVLPFGSPSVGVPLSTIMYSSGEGLGDVSTPTLAMLVNGVSPSSVSAPRPSIPTMPVVSFNFGSSTLVSPSARVVNPSTPLNTFRQSSMVVTRIPNVPFTSSP